MDELAVADTRTTGNYLTLYSPCDNKQLTIIPLPICMTNGEIIKSTHTTLLSKKCLTIEAWRAHIFSGLNKALLTIGTFFYHGCQSLFDDNTVLIVNKGNSKIMTKGKQDPLSNLYMLNLTQRNKLMTEFQTPEEYYVVSVYGCKLTGTLLDYHHASFWSPTQSEWVRSIK